MLDALEFAFETFVIGALALSWIGILSQMFPRHINASLPSTLRGLPKEAQRAVDFMVVIAFGYLLGLAVSRISRDFFDDEMLTDIRMPRESKIREQVYLDTYCTKHLVKQLNVPFDTDTAHPNSFALCSKWTQPQGYIP